MAGLSYLPDSTIETFIVITVVKSRISHLNRVQQLVKHKVAFWGQITSASAIKREKPSVMKKRFVLFRIAHPPTTALDNSLEFGSLASSLKQQL